MTESKMTFLKKTHWLRMSLLPLVLLTAACSAPQAEKDAGQRSPLDGGTPSMPMMDKSQDEPLQSMIKNVKPAFQSFVYKDDKTGLSVPYNLYIPKQSIDKTPLPLVLFIADASVVGKDVTAPLEQGYGGMIWATATSQLQNPSFVLVPQFPTVILDDHGSYTTSDYIELTARMTKYVRQQYNIDQHRVYATGQSMGAMTLMLLSAKHPDLFAAQMFVAGQWDINELSALKDQTFFYLVSAGDPKASAGQAELYDALTQQGSTISTAIWNARWDESQLTRATNALVEKGNRLNFVTFEKGTTLPAGTTADSPAGEHMYTFDAAYKIDAVRHWLFQQHKE
jgi:predicted peptidase